MLKYCGYWYLVKFFFDFDFCIGWKKKKKREKRVLLSFLFFVKGMI